MSSQQSRQDIERWLRQAGEARRRRILLVRACAAASVLGLAVAAVLVLLPWFPAARGWAVLALACLTGVSLLHVLAPLLRPVRPSTTARWLVRRAPGWGGGLADAWQFAGELEAGGRVETGSAELALAHVESAARGLSRRDPGEPARTAWPRTGARRAAAALACAVLALALLPRARSLLFLGIAPGLRDVARYEAVELRYAFPAYLRLEPRTEFGSGDVQAPIGTHVLVRVEADRPLEWARLELEGGAAQDMKVAGQVAEGRLVVQHDGAYRLVLQGVEGETDPEPPRHAVRAVPDREPTVRLSAPARDAVVPPGGDLDLVWRVADDHGVAELELVIEPEGEGAEPGVRNLARFEPPVLSRIGSRRLSLAELGLEPGESAWIRLRARDDDVVSGPKWSESRRVKVTARSEEEIRVSIDEAQDALAEALLALLAHQLVTAPERVAQQEELIAAAERFADGLAEALRLFPAVLRELEEGPEADLAAVQALEEMRERLKDLGRTRRRLAGRAFLETAPEHRLRDQLGRLQPGEVRELEADVLFFDMWADRRAALRASDSADELVDALEALTQALGEPDEELEPVAAEVEDALEAAESELGSLASLARELEQAVPEEVASQLRAGERAGEAQQLLQDVREAHGQGRLEDARWLARELRSRGEELARAVDELAAHGAVGDQELMQELRELQEQLRQLRARQADLRDRTNRIRDEAQDAMSEEDRQAMDELFQELIALAEEAVAQQEEGERLVAQAEAVRGFFDALDEVARMRDELRTLIEASESEGRLPSRAEQERQRRLRSRMNDLELRTLLGPNDVEPLMRHSEHSREQLGRLLQTLQDRDADGAQRPARHALYRLDELSRGLDRSEDRDLAERGMPFRTAQARVGDILTKLEELERRRQAAGQRALTDGQRAELQELSQQQRQLARMAAELAERLREAGADAPFLGDEIGEAVSRAGDGMRDAGGRLGEGEPARASESQGDALSRLEEAAKGLSPESGGRRQRPSDRRDGRRGLSRADDVEIPDADAYRVPKEFREEILQAMRESAAPRGYEEQVREYYRRLVE